MERLLPWNVDYAVMETIFDCKLLSSFTLPMVCGRTIIL